jgi:hypothetical protein
MQRFSAQLRRTSRHRHGRNWMVLGASGSVREFGTAEPRERCHTANPRDSLGCSFHGSTG